MLESSFNCPDTNSSGGLGRAELGGEDPEGEGEGEGESEGSAEGEGESEGQAEGEGEGDGEGTMCAANGVKSGAPGAVPPDWILLVLVAALLYRRRHAFHTKRSTV